MSELCKNKCSSKPLITLNMVYIYLENCFNYMIFIVCCRRQEITDSSYPYTIPSFVVMPLIWSYFHSYNSIHSTPAHSSSTSIALSLCTILHFQFHLAPNYIRLAPTLRKDFVILQLYWWLFSSTKHCS